MENNVELTHNEKVKNLHNIFTRTELRAILNSVSKTLETASDFVLAQDWYKNPFIADMIHVQDLLEFSLRKEDE